MAAKSSRAIEPRQLEKVEVFRGLHTPGSPLVLYNVWDAGSAQVVAKSGARAIATSSWAVAKSHGFNDGEQVPFDLAMQNLRRIVKAVDLPVSVDLESGYGDEPAKVAKSISLAIEAGAVGCNLEDSFPEDGTIRDVAAQVDRIRAAREAADAVEVPFFINARCDLFFQRKSIPHDKTLLAQAVERVHAYADVGADGFFVPGLTTPTLIAELAKKSPLPVNILADHSTSIQTLTDSGVARISYGATPYVEALEVLERAAKFHR